MQRRSPPQQSVLRARVRPLEGGHFNDDKILLLRADLAQIGPWVVNARLVGTDRNLPGTNTIAVWSRRESIMVTVTRETERRWVLVVEVAAVVSLCAGAAASILHCRRIERP